MELLKSAQELLTILVKENLVIARIIGIAVLGAVAYTGVVASTLRQVNKARSVTTPADQQ